VGEIGSRVIACILQVGFAVSNSVLQTETLSVEGAKGDPMTGSNLDDL